MIVLWVILTFIGIAITALIANAVEDYNSTLKFPIQSTLQGIGLPIIALYNNNKIFNFLIDSGANLSLIDSNIVSELKCDYLDNKGTMYGIGGNIVDVTYISVPLYIEDSMFTEEFQVMDLDPTFCRIEKKNGVRIHGVLGNSFFNKYNGIINYKKYIFYLEKNGKKDNSTKQKCK
ncbi:MAG: retroviral-like aspartic protease [Lachnospiraceae bacterium]|nr:retroviral-like aspartic protease [Lachnospiraceae bacterium]